MILEVGAQLGGILKSEGLQQRKERVFPPPVHALPLLKRGVLIRVTGDIIALSPPLIIEEGQIDQIVNTIGEALARAA